MSEKSELGLKIVIEVRMLYSTYVVASDIKECAGFECDSRDPVILESLAGHLHRHMAYAAVEGIIHMHIELHDLRRREVRLLFYHAVIIVYAGAYRASSAA